jgi:hypothetical protein
MGQFCLFELHGNIIDFVIHTRRNSLLPSLGESINADSGISPYNLPIPALNDFKLSTY